MTTELLRPIPMLCPICSNGLLTIRESFFYNTYCPVLPHFEITGCDMKQVYTIYDHPRLPTSLCFYKNDRSNQERYVVLDSIIDRHRSVFLIDFKSKRNWLIEGF